MMRVLAALIMLCFAIGGAAAMSEAERLDDPALEARARALSSELRCLVCQNQSIDASDATFARDMRQLVRERLVAGDSDDQVVAFLVDRYGEFVRLRPPMNASTVALWAMPFVVALIAIIGVGVYLRGQRKTVLEPSTGLSEDEEKALAAVLDERR